MNALKHLWKSRLRRLVGYFRSDQTRPYQVPIFVTIATIFWIALYQLAKWIGVKAIQIQPVGDLALQGLLSLILAVIFAVLIFSNTVTSFNTFFSDTELKFLVQTPIDRDAFFISRFLETLLHASWIVFVFGVPFLTGLGVAVKASTLYYPLIAVVLVPFAVIPTSLGSLISIAFARLWQLTRNRKIVLYSGLLLLVGGVFAFRLYEPHQLLSPETFESANKILNLLSAPVSIWIPSQWAAEVLFPSFFGTGSVNLEALTMLYLTALTSFFVTIWVYRKYFFRSYSSAQEGQHQGGYLAELSNRFQKMTTRSTSSTRNPTSQPKDHWRSLVAKDFRVTIRDPGQWTQLIVVIALLVLYLFNYQYFGVAADIELVSGLNLYFFNLLVGDFILVALTGRFLFPSVSLEGRNFWFIRQAPISMENYLISKTIGSMLPVVVVGQVFVWLSLFLVAQSVLLSIGGALTILFHSVIISSLAICFGAVFPQFHNPNAAKIASGFGAVIFMVVAIFLCLFSLAFIISPLLSINSVSQLGLIGIEMITIGVVIPLAIAYGILKAGAYTLKDKTGY